VNGILPGSFWGLFAGLYLGMTVVTPLLNGGFHVGGRYAEHAMMVSLMTIAMVGLSFLARRSAARRREKS
jgi:hypothetical protein